MSVRLSHPLSSFTSSVPAHPWVDTRKASLPPLPTALPTSKGYAEDLTTHWSGLRTPPVDNMAATYHPGGPGYDGHGLPTNHATLGARGRLTTVPDARSWSAYQRYPTSMNAQQPVPSMAMNAVPQQQFQPHPPLVSSNGEVRQNSSVLNGQFAPRSSSPMLAGTAPFPVHEDAKSVGEPETLIHHSFQIPKCISTRGGSLSEFAARMTCLFWFETGDELNKAKTIKSQPANSRVAPLPELAKPLDPFLKWIHSVLSTTQVTQNVILLALLFIYRLKQSTPRIKGRSGSEYRLLTVALMLSNKFLDDNTYTNKTWAEVSYFAVTEIHVMEVEFLNNLRYNLLVSAKEWEEWLNDLAGFHEYYERALAHPPSPPNILPSPVNANFYSPKHGINSMSALPLLDNSLVPTTGNRLSPNAAFISSLSNYQQDPLSPLAGRKSIENLAPPKKRSLESEICEHPPKRAAPYRPIANPRLAVPQLSVVTHVTPPPNVHSAQDGFPVSKSAIPSDILSLPPLQAGVRAMSTVYHPTPMVPTPAATISTPIPLDMSSGQAYSAATLASHQQQQQQQQHHHHHHQQQHQTQQQQHPQALGYRTPSKHRSPTNMASAYTSSPLGELMPGSASIGTPIGQMPFFNSPMTYLEQRHSPYRPIRHVHHLGQATSLDHYHLAVPGQPPQMHYQPLGRRDEVRSGVVPEFLVYNRQPPQQLPTPGFPQNVYPH